MTGSKRNATLNTMSNNKATVQNVREYWNANPLLSHELDYNDLKAFFREFNRIKLEDVERFSLEYWDFNGYAGKKVLDIGCGPGWITTRYARGGAEVTAVDLTPKAVELTKSHLEALGLNAEVREGNAETLPLPDDAFDLVVSSGVLHHTPDTRKAFEETFRVLRPGGRAKITLYRKGVLHSRAVFPLVKGLMRLLSVGHPGARKMYAQNVDEFVRQYDGEDNPVGIAMTNRDWRSMLESCGFIYLSAEIHFFPVRFFPATYRFPVWVHKILDGWFGTMVYFNLRK